MSSGKKRKMAETMVNPPMKRLKKDGPKKDLVGKLYHGHIRQTLLFQEERNHPNCNQWTSIQDSRVTVNMKNVLVMWIIEVVNDFKIGRKTLFLALNYLNRYLASSRLQHPGKFLQLLGVTCLFISSKMEEVSPLTLKDCVYVTVDTYSEVEVINMEAEILGTLKFDLVTSTVVDFLPFYRKEHNVPEDEEFFVILNEYLAELSLTCERLNKFLPSLIARCIVYLSFRVFGQRDSLNTFVVPKTREWDECLNLLSNTLRAPHQYLHDKYNQNDYFRIASFGQNFA
eukprot:TRINITY_DN2034_c0_g1_i1.p1 TRINITY_DN2034_c0_g1~~TRINITY_DN2034_c0_g1_i1.p1  ORF type:complete len:285 (+),score=32.56 TRINITY_DN2034_c0_g1_i1:152-1006(+)